MTDDTRQKETPAAPPLSDDSSTDEDQPPPYTPQPVYPLLPSPEELPGHPVVTAAALAHQTAQGNPTVRRFSQKDWTRRSKTKVQGTLSLRRRTTSSPRPEPSTAARVLSVVCTIL